MQNDTRADQKYYTSPPPALITQRKRYDPELWRVLSDNQSLRDQADYRPELVTATQAGRALRRSRLFVAAVRQRGGVAQ